MQANLVPLKEVLAVLPRFQLELDATTVAGMAVREAHRQLAPAVADAAREMFRAGMSANAVFEALKKAGQATDEDKSKIEALSKAHRDLGQNLDELTTSFAQLAQIGGESFQGIVQGIGVVLGSMKTLDESMASIRSALDPEDDQSAFSLDSIVSFSSGVMGIIGVVGGLVQQFFGVSKEIKEARADVTQLETSLRASATAAQLNEAAMSGWGSTGALTAITVRDAYLATGRSAAAAEIIVKQLWDTDNPDRARAAIEKINAVLREQTAAIEAARLATQQEGEAREFVRQTIEKYKISIEDAGAAWRAQELTAQANDLYREYRALVASGIEVGVVTEAMADAVNAYLRVALSTGTEVPRSMQPMLEAMMLQGRLTDENGEKLTDLGRVSWATTLTEGFEMVVDKLDELIRKILGLPSSAAEAAEGMQEAFDDLDIVIPVEFDDGGGYGGGSGGSGGYDPYAAGGVVTPVRYAARGLLPFVPRGTDTVPAMLTPGEGVVTRQGMSLLGPVGLSALNRGHVTAGGPATIIDLSAVRDEVRALRETVKYAPSHGAFRIYIIDEVHQITHDAFNALLKTLEEPPAHVKFIFATTAPHKVPPTILSRCQRFDFRRIEVKTIVEVLQRMVKAEKVAVDEAALKVGREVEQRNGYR